MKAIVLLKITSGEMDEAFYQLKKLNIVTECCKPFGRYDAAAMTQAESLEELWQIVSCQIGGICGVIETFPCLIQEDMSLNHLPQHVQDFAALSN